MLTFTDDLVITTQEKNILKRIIRKISEEAERIGLTINEQKMSYMTNEHEYSFELTHLENKIGGNGKEYEEIKDRIAKKRQKYGTLVPLIMSQFVARRTKRPERLERWERKMLRAIYGDANANAGLRKRTNKELEGLYKKYKITL